MITAETANLKELVGQMSVAKTTEAIGDWKRLVQEVENVDQIVAEWFNDDPYVASLNRALNVLQTESTTRERVLREQQLTQDELRQQQQQQFYWAQQQQQLLAQQQQQQLLIQQQQQLLTQQQEQLFQQQQQQPANIRPNSQLVLALPPGDEGTDNMDVDGV